MNDFRLDIPPKILDYARLTFMDYVPLERTGGFQETEHQSRGDGDLLDLTAKLTLHHFLAGEQRKFVKMEMTCGAGDDHDLVVKIPAKTSWDRKVNIKTSRHEPFGEGLHLFVKQEELNHPCDIYIQCFVHLHEIGETPHLHVAGFCAVSSPLWLKYAQLDDIPETAGHRGMKIPVEELRPIEGLLKILLPRA